MTQPSGKPQLPDNPLPDNQLPDNQLPNDPQPSDPQPSSHGDSAAPPRGPAQLTSAMRDLGENVGEFADTVASEVRTLRRSRTNRKLAGVCGGLADYFGVDATMLRILLVAATLFGVGAGAVLYLICWLLIPEAE